MFDASLFGLLNSLRATFYARLDCDIVDRVNYYYTSLVFIIMMILSVARTYIGSAINCWCPAEFTGAHVAYTENWCWISDTYWLRDGEYPPKDKSQRELLKIHYYQWVPFVFVLMALFQFIPSIIWRLLGWKSGIDLRMLSHVGLNIENLKEEVRKKSTTAIAIHLQSVFDLQRARRHATSDFMDRIMRTVSRLFIFCWCIDFFGTRHYGTFLTGCYLTFKLLYLAVIPCQLLILRAFFGYTSMFQGVSMIQALLNATDWQQTGHFPRVTLCDVSIRAYGTDRAATVQCVLPVNLLYEKFYLVLWFWLVVSFILTVVNIILWLARIFSPMSRLKFVRKYLKLGGTDVYSSRSDDKKLVTKFVHSNLGQDGVLVLRLFAMNVGFVMTYDVIRLLWRAYRERHAALFRNLAPETEAEESTPGGRDKGALLAAGVFSRSNAARRSPIGEQVV